QDPLDRLVEESRPAWQRWLRWGFYSGVKAYAIALALWIAIAPLVAARYHTVASVGVLITPFLVFLTSIALLAGFLLILLSTIWMPLGFPAARLTSWCLTATDWFVDR